ncbi:MAG: hypothetical protein ACR2QU_00985, partial [Gammaproteobacteria bacterium]
ARAHHLGKVKRRTRLFRVRATTPPTEGQSVVENDRAVGKVARVARVGGRDASDDRYLLLAVTSTTGKLRLDDEASSELEEQALPYKLPG